MININDFNLPILNIGNRQGDTDYIDFIRPNQVEYPAMKGYDLFNRPFIVIKFYLDYKHICVQTFFQRYSNNKMFWLSAGHFGQHLINTRTGITIHQTELISKILNGQKVQLTKEHQPICNSLIGKYVELYDEQKSLAAIFIQRHWRLCRYNPKYKMCEKVQMRNFELIK